MMHEVRGFLLASLAVLSSSSLALFATQPGSAQPLVDSNAETGAAERACKALAGRQVGGAEVISADYIPTGGPTLSPLIKTKSNICKVSARVAAAPGSQINIRVWLPSKWNGKLLGAGGAGFNGGVAAEWFTTAGPMDEGYATFATDAGHEPSEGAAWAFKQPEKLLDYGYRANHLGAVAAKAIVSVHYGRDASRSYFHGCSNGGRDALMLAQRYPADFDGIIAGAPAQNWTPLVASFAETTKVTRPFRGETSLGSKLTLLHNAALKKCDLLDGAKDGLISNPSACRFDPAVLQCKTGSGPACLSVAEVNAVRGLYSGTRTGNGKLIMPGFAVGSELNWGQWFKVPEKEVLGMAREVFRYMVYDDPEWDWTTFDIDRDFPLLDRRLGPILNANDPNLRPFAGRGGKLLMYHGWEDTAIPAASSIRYFEAARRKLRHDTASARLFMVPGLGHCFGGSGPNVIDFVGALDKWVDAGKAPEELISSQYENFGAAMTGQPTKLLQTRPVCAWPKVPHYRGRGPLDQAASFACRRAR